jgi:hypothetical protein
MTMAINKQVCSLDNIVDLLSTILFTVVFIDNIFTNKNVLKFINYSMFRLNTVVTEMSVMGPT